MARRRLENWIRDLSPFNLSREFKAYDISHGRMSPTLDPSSILEGHKEIQDKERTRRYFLTLRGTRGERTRPNPSRVDRTGWRTIIGSGAQGLSARLASLTASTSKQSPPTLIPQQNLQRVGRPPKHILD